MIRIFTSPSSARHEVPPGFPEQPERLVRILSQLEATEWPIESVAGHDASRDRVASLHAASYIDRLEQAVAAGARWLDSGDNPLSAGTVEAAWGSVDAALAAVDWVVSAERRIAFAAVRPPGHHAERGAAMGFCYFNNIAAAAQQARVEHGLERVAIVDFDVHHGNGTQHLFEARSDVAYLSLHQWPFYPGTGAASERGTGDGLGATVNVPLPAGSDDGVYRQAFERTILPALADLAPELLLLSAGFDAWRFDPLGGMRVTRDGFAEWGRWLGGLAARCCAGRVVAVLEGGYDIDAIPELIVDHLGGLLEGVEAE